MTKPVLKNLTAVLPRKPEKEVPLLAKVARKKGNIKEKKLLGESLLIPQIGTLQKRILVTKVIKQKKNRKRNLVTT